MVATSKIEVMAFENLAIGTNPSYHCHGPNPSCSLTRPNPSSFVAASICRCLTAVDQSPLFIVLFSVFNNHPHLRPQSLGLVCKSCSLSLVGYVDGLDYQDFIVLYTLEEVLECLVIVYAFQQLDPTIEAYSLAKSYHR